MKKLDHPALPRIVDILENERNIQIVMDYIEGEPLSNLLAATGPQKQADVIDWAIQIAEVLEYLHTRNPAIIYRDMKPSNVMLSPNGKIKLIDFGVARENHGEGFNSSDNLGTPGYAAPEQMHNRPIDQRTDIYSLGVSLYQLITGQVPPKEPPFDLYPIRYWNPELSGGLERIIQKCTQVNPDDRYSTCVELIYDLEHYEEVDDAFRTGKKKLLNRFITATGLALFFLIAGFGAFWGHSIKQNSSYLEMIGQAEKTNDVTQAQDLYLKAITIMPYETAPYLGLIETYKDDASFSSEEHEQLVKVLNKNLAGLKEVENYPDLAFETGKLYWFYYDYGKTSESDNQMTRMKSSVRWFQDAFEMTAETYPNHQMARIYTSIGQFNRDITLKVEEASDKGSYITYWQDIQNLSQSIGSSSESDLVQLEFFRLTLQAIETYAHKFKAESVSRQDLEKVFDQAKRFVTTNKPTTEKTRTLKAYLESRLPAAEQSIVHAFAN